MDIKQIQEGSSVFFLTAARPRSRARKTIGMKWSGASCHFNFNLFFTRLLQIMEKRILEKLQDHYQNFVEENLLYANCEKYLVEFIFEEYFVIDFLGLFAKSMRLWRLKSGHIIFELKHLWYLHFIADSYFVQSDSQE